jgi:hypothetical protein
MTELLIDCTALLAASFPKPFSFHLGGLAALREIFASSMLGEATAYSQHRREDDLELADPRLSTGISP